MWCLKMKQNEYTEYIADGVYAEWEGFQVRLFATDGIKQTNEIFLEPHALAAVVNFVQRMQMKQKEKLKEALTTEEPV